MRSSLHALVCLGFACALAVSANAMGEVERVNYVSMAEGAYIGQQYSLAVEHVHAAIVSGNLAPIDLARAHRVRGLVLVTQNDRRGAEDAFRISLLIDESQSTPTELDATWRPRFEALRRRPPAPPLHLHVRHGAVSDAPLPLQIRTVAAPPGLVANYWLSIQVAGFSAWTLFITAGQPIAVPQFAWRTANSITLEVMATDVHGNVLVGTSIEVSR